MARASWKLCSMSGLHTPSASLSMGLSKAWLPPETLLPSGELGEPHSLEVMVPALPSKAPLGGAPVGPVWAETTRASVDECVDVERGTQGVPPRNQVLLLSCPLQLRNSKKKARDPREQSEAEGLGGAVKSRSSSVHQPQLPTL